MNKIPEDHIDLVFEDLLSGGAKVDLECAPITCLGIGELCIKTGGITPSVLTEQGAEE